MREADRHAPRTLIKSTGKLVKLGLCVIGDLVIIFHLVGRFSHTGTGHRAHIVIPPINPLTGFAVIGGPAEISGINVSGQTFLKAVHLIWANKVHLA